MSHRVLLCDADESLLRLYGDHLRERGFEVATATDGLACVAKLREFRPDVLVLEPRVLWGRGAGVIAMMREEPDVPMTAVIVVTSGRDPQASQGLEAVPIHDYHFKPLAPERLEESIGALIAHRPEPGRDPPRFTEPPCVDLNVEVEHWIDQRTFGRIHDLHVDSTEDRVIVHGYTGSYYARQLALAAALEALEASGTEGRKSIELDVTVVGR